jgi:hypothetical protein
MEVKFVTTSRFMCIYINIQPTCKLITHLHLLLRLRMCGALKM